jgi:hypothetical protein
MTEKLNMSLDQIIQRRAVSDGKKAVKSNGDRHKNFAKFDRKHNEQERGPVKVITLQRPRIVKPDGGNVAANGPRIVKPEGSHMVGGSKEKDVVGVATASKDVFSRLGVVGAHVLFKNLATSVKQQDVQELCRVIGEVKTVQFLRGLDGLGQAKVHFATFKAAQACVKKYEGELEISILSIVVRY